MIEQPLSCTVIFFLKNENKYNWSTKVITNCIQSKKKKNDNKKKNE